MLKNSEEIKRHQAEVEQHQKGPHRLPADAEPQLMVVAFGHNKPGTLHPVTDVIRSHGASIMESKTLNLARNICVMMSVYAGDNNQRQALLSALHELEARQSDLRHSAQCHVAVSLYENSQELIAAHGFDVAQPGYDYHLKLTGGQQAGLIHQVLEFLAVKECHLRDLETKTERSNPYQPMLFSLESSVHVPGNLSPDVLHAELKQLASQLGLHCAFDQWKGHKYGGAVPII